jgi:hypothetical protein
MGADVKMVGTGVQTTNWKGKSERKNDLNEWGKLKDEMSPGPDHIRSFTKHRKLNHQSYLSGIPFHFM